MDAEKSDTTSESPERPKRSWRRAMVATSVLGGMLLSGLSVLPSAVMNSSHRDRVLNAEFQKFGLTASSASGSGGWLTAFTFNEVTVSDENGQFQCTIDSIQTSKSLLGIMSSGSDLGTITIVRPSLHVALDEEGNIPLTFPTDDNAAWDVDFDIQDSSFVLNVSWRDLPIVDVADIDVQASLRNREDGRWLEVAPIVIADHKHIDESHTQQNLALIAPVLAQSTALSGEVSARMEAMKVKLGGGQIQLDNPIRGHAVFHVLEARLRQDWADQVSRMMGILAGNPKSNRLQIAADSSVDFEVNDDGIYHQGLAFLLPELVGSTYIESSGLVGIDESLDLTLGVKLPGFLSHSPFLGTLSKMVRKPLQLKVVGTVSRPEVVTPAASTLVDQLARNLKPSDQPVQEAAPSVPDTVIELIGAATSSDPSEASDGIASGVLNIIRAAQEARKNAPPREPRRKKRERPRRDL